MATAWCRDLHGLWLYSIRCALPVPDASISSACGSARSALLCVVIMLVLLGGQFGHCFSVIVCLCACAGQTPSLKASSYRFTACCFSDMCQAVLESGTWHPTSRVAVLNFLPAEASCQGRSYG